MKQWEYLYHPKNCVKVTLIETKGSTPRNKGAYFILYENGEMAGSIGGGALEYKAIEQAKSILINRPDHPFMREIAKMPLGPNLGQCCGGYVKVLYEFLGASDKQAYLSFVENGKLHDKFIAIPHKNAGDIYITDQENNNSDAEYYMAITPPAPHIYLYGAGHVGTAILQHLRPFHFVVHWVDFQKNRFCGNYQDICDEILVHDDMAFIAKHAKKGVIHLVMTHDHQQDFNIIDALLSRDDFKFLGLIGSITKWQRFKNRLLVLGHDSIVVDKVTCPIGINNIHDKTPHAIAISCVAQLLELSLVK